MGMTGIPTWAIPLIIIGIPLFFYGFSKMLGHSRVETNEINYSHNGRNFPYD